MIRLETNNLLLLVDGKVYIKRNDEEIYQVVFPNNTYVKHISSDNYTACAVDTYGKLYLWLYQEDDHVKQMHFKDDMLIKYYGTKSRTPKIPLFFTDKCVKKIYRTCLRSYILTENGDIYTLGFPDCAVPRWEYDITQLKNEPHKLSFSKGYPISNIYCEDRSYAIDIEGNIYLLNMSETIFMNRNINLDSMLAYAKNISEPSSNQNKILDYNTKNYYLDSEKSKIKCDREYHGIAHIYELYQAGEDNITYTEDEFGIRIYKIEDHPRCRIHALGYYTCTDYYKIHDIYHTDSENNFLYRTEPIIYARIPRLQVKKIVSNLHDTLILTTDSALYSIKNKNRYETTCITNTDDFHLLFDKGVTDIATDTYEDNSIIIFIIDGVVHMRKSQHSPDIIHNINIGCNEQHLHKTKIQFPSNIKSIVCNHDLLLALSVDNELYAYGFDPCKLLGKKYSELYNYGPARIDYFENLNINLGEVALKTKPARCNKN